MADIQTGRLLGRHLTQREYRKGLQDREAAQGE